jgi:hypothetical protein
MSDLLIHSMSEFSSLILEALELTQVRNIVEIGAEFGGMSSVLADHCGKAGGRFTTIDPAPKQAFIDWVAEHPHVTHLAAPSLEVMGDQEQVDAWVIDGDHNYYTVLRELRLADSVARRDGRPCWPLCMMWAGPARAAILLCPRPHSCRTSPALQLRYGGDAGLCRGSAGAGLSRHGLFRLGG